MKMNFKIETLLAIGSTGAATELLEPTVLIVLLVRNKAHTLPYFLTLLGEQDYPKDRVKLWIRTDHNEDASAEILKLWIGATGHHYKSVDFKVDDSGDFLYDDEDSAWSG